MGELPIERDQRISMELGQGDVLGVKGVRPPEQADPFTNTVTVTIGRLRRKLGDPPVISTTPGVGYRIADPAT